MIKAMLMLAGLSLAISDTSTLGGVPMQTKTRRSRMAFAKSQITKGAKHKSQVIRANRRKSKLRSRKWK